MAHGTKILELKTKEANSEMPIRVDIMNLELALCRTMGVISQKELTPTIHRKYNLH